MVRGMKPPNRKFYTKNSPAKHSSGKKEQGKNARSLALDILSDVFEHRKTIDESMQMRAYEKGISLTDKAFAYRLASEVVRRKGIIDALLAGFLTKPLKPSQVRVNHALMLGVVQLCVLDTPPHAAVHETVQVIADSSFAPLKGLVNAVLQNILRALPACKEKMNDPARALPDAVREAWALQYGNAMCEAAGKLLLQKPPLDISVKQNPAEWAKKLGGAHLRTNTIRITQDVKVEELPGFKEGEWWVQDAGACLAVEALGDVKGKHVLDICAAPGGKTAQLMAAGAKVTSIDSSAKRMERFAQNMQRLKFSPEIRVEDIRIWKPQTKFDAVLLDAPCSATGTFRKHPEVLWNRLPADVARLKTLQRECLSAVLGWLPHDVPLIYTVCSMETEEGESLIAEMLEKHKELALEPLPIQGFNQNDGLRLLPLALDASGGNDGFYIARLIKR